MTYKERLKQEDQDHVDKILEDGCMFCPDAFGYEDFSYCIGMSDCEECWNREIPEQEDKQ